MRSSPGRTLDQLVPDALVISLRVIVLDELSCWLAKIPLAYRNGGIQAFRLDCPDKVLRVRAAVRRRGRRAHDENAGCTEQRVHRAAPLRIAVTDEVLTGAKKLTIGREFGEVPGSL
jgi:hypothetical protein